MTQPAVNRRAVFGQMSSGCGFGATLSDVPTPEKAWIIVALGWEYNDEYTYHEGESPQQHVYYDKTQADAACQRLCDEFFGRQTPQQFEIDWEWLFPDGLDDPSGVTWKEVRDAGFPEPYYVMELSQDPILKRPPS